MRNYIGMLTLNVMWHFFTYSNHNIAYTNTQLLHMKIIKYSKVFILVYKCFCVAIILCSCCDFICSALRFCFLRNIWLVGMHFCVLCHINYLHTLSSKVNKLFVFIFIVNNTTFISKMTFVLLFPL